MAYYSDPSFSTQLQGMNQTQQVFGGPFAGTRNAIAQRLQGNRSIGFQNMLNQQKAAALYQQAGFNNQMAWDNWNAKLARANKDLVARQQINAQRTMANAAARASAKSARSGLFGQLAGIGGGVLGAIVGGPVGYAAGSSAGQMAGSQLG